MPAMAMRNDCRSCSTLSSALSSGDLSNHFGIIISADQPMAERPALSVTRSRTNACDVPSTLAAPNRNGIRNVTGRSKATMSLTPMTGASVMPQLTPWTASTDFMRDTAKAGSASTRALSANRKSSARCCSERVDCCPPIMAKWSCRPLR